MKFVVLSHNFPNLKLCSCAKVLILDELLQKEYGLGSGWVAQLRLLSLLLMVGSTSYVGHSKISCCPQAFHSSLRPTFATLANEFLQQIRSKDGKGFAESWKLLLFSWQFGN